MEKPTKEQIKEARTKAGLTQKQAADLLDLPSYQAWQAWEIDRSRMPSYAFDYFLLKTDQHPDYRLTKRRKSKD